MTDMKVCYATMRGFEALRDTKLGSWYVISTCKIWSEHAHNKDLDHLMRMVGEDSSLNQSEKGYRQTATNEEIGWYRALYFNPGFYPSKLRLEEKMD